MSEKGQKFQNLYAKFLKVRIHQKLKQKLKQLPQVKKQLEEWWIPGWKKKPLVEVFRKHLKLHDPESYVWVQSLYELVTLMGEQPLLHPTTGQNMLLDPLRLSPFEFPTKTAELFNTMSKHMPILVENVIDQFKTLKNLWTKTIIKFELSDLVQPNFLKKLLELAHDSAVEAEMVEMVENEKQALFWNHALEDHPTLPPDRRKDTEAYRIAISRWQRFLIHLFRLWLIPTKKGFAALPTLTLEKTFTLFNRMPAHAIFVVLRDIPYTDTEIDLFSSTDEEEMEMEIPEDMPRTVAGIRKMTKLLTKNNIPIDARPIYLAIYKWLFEDILATTIDPKDYGIFLDSGQAQGQWAAMLGMRPEWRRLLEFLDPMITKSLAMGSRSRMTV